jgi:hypothetical protein
MTVRTRRVSAPAYYLGRTRRVSAPAYYLGRPATLWLAALTPSPTTPRASSATKTPQLIPGQGN